MSRERPLALAPAAALAAAVLGTTALLHRLTGGREIGDDADYLLRFVREPGLLLDAGASGLPETWSAFPPLLPYVFAVLVRPFLGLGDFWAIRLGTLAWSIVALVLLAGLARRAPGLEGASRRHAVWFAAAVPTTLLACAVIPQEEAYVACFAIGLFALGVTRRDGWLGVLLVATVLAGKLLLLALVVPIAWAGPDPLRRLLRLGAVGGGAAALVVGLQLASGGPSLLGYEIPIASGSSIFAVLEGVGLALPAATARASAVLTALAVVAFSLVGVRRGLDPVALVAGSLWLLQLVLAVAMPPYLVWNTPFLALWWARQAPTLRAWSALLLVLWCGLTYAAKLLRGVALTLEMDRTAGKDAIAGPIVAVLGDGFPFGAARTAALALAAAIGVGFVILLARPTASVSDPRRPKQQKDRRIPAGPPDSRWQAS